MKLLFALVVASGLSVSAAEGPALQNGPYVVSVTSDGALLVQTAGAAAQRFKPRFTVLSSPQDPKLQWRFGDWQDPQQMHVQL
jgi:hypothetical protein